MAALKSDMVNRLEHTWVLNATYVLSNPDKDAVLDMENLLYLSGPECPYCGKPYRAEIRDEECPAKTNQNS